MEQDSQFEAEIGSETDSLPNAQVLSELIQRASDGAEPAELADILKADPVLCYALLTEFSSNAAVLADYVTSCKQAVERMGSAALIDWLNAALEHAIKVPEFSDTVRNTLIRARFMELMGQSLKLREDVENAYLVGLFSRLDRLLGIPLPELILPLPFPEEMRAGILEQSGRIGRLLKFARTIEAADEHG
ncbi:MAG: HDOD domain-containing protein, partial [Burkholderiales bacterium]